MADDGRNFRYHYYDKVGFRGVEEKKSLEILLRDKPLDLNKLTKFCLRFSLPSMYREYVWKLLLGVLPPNPDTHKLVAAEQKEQYDYLERSLKLMRKINNNTPTSEKLVYMLLLQQGRLILNQEKQFQETSTKNMIAIASTFTKMSLTKEDSYWMLRNFCISQQKFSNILPMLPERMEAILKKNDPELYSWLENLNVLHILPTDLWFERCFAEILSEAALERIWDKVIAGCCKILAFVGAALLIILRHPLLGMKESEEVLKYLIKVPDDTADTVANKALELWQEKEER